MITLLLDGHSLGYPMENTVRIFLPNEDIFLTYSQAELKDNYIITKVKSLGETTKLFVQVNLNNFEKELECTLESPTKREVQRGLTSLLFRLLKEHTSGSPSWGMLTGVRPVKLIRNLQNKGLTDSQVATYLEDEFFVKPNKAQLGIATANNEKAIIESHRKTDYCLYISIPFCPSRCLYCSFISSAIKQNEKLLDDYLPLLCKEITATVTLANQLGLQLRAVYIGGGTPTTLNEQQLEMLLQHIQGEIGESFNIEYTLEAGRPETITKGKLSIAKRYGVNRISVNPQTLNDKVLKEIGRKHTVNDFYKSFNLAKESGIQVINTDLIVGLPNETEESFLEGLAKIISLNPENITIHTLTLKRSSTLNQQNYSSSRELSVELMLDNSNKLLARAGYQPYYLYRQKRTVENQENVGYCKPNTESYYNVIMMEDEGTVLGVGAGCTTKLVLLNRKIKRIYNFKFPNEYINNFQEIINRKELIREYYDYAEDKPN